ncbi:serine/threonine-protein kinase [Embleya hyalina]|uniref:non-specific serine/threonine protein kinase n=1 Tax=Embleya hyalina TaxID=516124 RepID=A0A401YF99_9ACTN|nr:serine/threonine-protein kinase [Embleya hyalina]GCD93238.1 protein kinase [Embleya hyalina]
MDDDHGQLLSGRYRLSRLLGQGGMGAVWRAHDERLGRDVAIKELRLPSHLEEPERQNRIARLDREARAAARLKHPGIITVHDRISGPDGRPWIIMELVDGGSLADLIQAQGALTPERTADVGRQVAAALDAAHRMGITHRDIKPANILLEEERVVLTDFGIAALEGDATLTATGMIMGTPAFMAPEQVRGLPATAESDLWSLGATLYAAVEGRAPFAGTTPSAVLVAVATEPPIPAARAGALGPVLDGLLHKDPAARPTMDRLQAVLNSVAAPTPPAAGPDTLVPPTMPAWSPTVRQTAPRPTPEPEPAPHRPFPRRAKLGVATLVLAMAAGAGYIISQGAGDDSRYEANRKVAEALTVPAGFSRPTTTRVRPNRAQVTYTWPAPCIDHCADQVRLATEWMARQPGVARIDALGAELGGCLDDEYGCPILIVRVPSYEDPTLQGAALQTKNNRLSLRVDVGR